MDIGDQGTLTALAGLIIVIGLAGVVLPLLPGLPLAWGGVLIWALARHDAAGWTVLAIATALLVAGSAAGYLLPGRRLRDAGVPTTSLAAGGVLAAVGFFVVPVVGAVLGFVAGVHLAERLRVGRGARASTRSALAAVGTGVAVELLAGLLMAGTWLAAVALT